MNLHRQSQLSEFLRNRRARLQPDDVGLPRSRVRRVPGLRREEVAALAGVGVTWYTLLERGIATGVSPETLSAIQDALRLNESERAYVARLLSPVHDPALKYVADPVVATLVRDDVAVPAYLCTSHWDVPVWNSAYALVWNIPRSGPGWNLAERFFLDMKMREIFGCAWIETARAMTGMIRAGFAAMADDRKYTEMVQRLLVDQTFADLWPTFDVMRPRDVTHAQIVSPTVGTFSYSVLNMGLPTTDDGVVVVQVPDEHSRAALRRKMLEADP